MASDSIVAETATRIFRDLCDPQTLNRAADGSWKAPAWTALEDAGLTLAWVPDELGGAGAEIADGFAVLRGAGRYAVALPIAETMLAGWLLARAGISSPRGAMSCGPTRDGDRLTLTRGTLAGRLRAVPFANGARHIAVLAERESGGTAVALVEADAVRIAEGANIAGDALNAVVFDGVQPVAVKDAPAGLDGEALLLMGATVRAMQMAGALEAVLDASVSYANERVAFERPIAKFQAVQHNLARLAGETAVAMAAAGSAADAIATFYSPPLHAEGVSSTRRGEGLGVGGSPTSDVLESPPPRPSPTRGEGEDAVFLEAAAAKIRVGEAAGEGAAIAHQVLGAIGFTKEHTLHRFTQRLWAWRDDFGNESFWAVKLGNRVAANGADALWPMLAGR
jgi:alkylation response protein AidB-like acyl-CoA dehydrogenase